MALTAAPSPPAVERGVERGTRMLAEIVEAGECVSRAGGAPVESLEHAALGEVVSELARVEARAAALRLALSAEADRRRVSEETAETGTDA
jgi:hypothetical protein